MQVRLGIFDKYEDTLLSMQSLYARSILDMEFKDDAGNFEEYNSNWMYLKAVAYEEGMTYDFSQPDSFPTKVIRIDMTNDKVSDLEKQLAEVLEIPSKELIILLRHERSYNNTVSTEYYNMAWRREKKIQEVSKFDHGAVLYCERGLPEDNFDERKWKQEFATEAERMTLSMNDPHSDPEAMRFDVRVSLPRTNTVKQLKEIIAKRMQLSINEFYLIRSANDKEIKELNKTLVFIGLSDHSQIKIVIGKPEMEGVYKIKLSVVHLVDDLGKDNQIFEVEPLG